MLLTSKSEHLTPVNIFQEQEFSRLGITSRDPMFQTFATLAEIELYADEAALLKHCASFGEKQQNAAKAAELERFSKKHSLTERVGGQASEASEGTSSKL